MGLLASMRKKMTDWKPKRKSAVEKAKEEKKKKRVKPEVKAKRKKHGKSVAERKAARDKERGHPAANVRMEGEKRTAILLRLPSKLLKRIDERRYTMKGGVPSRPVFVAQLLEKALGKHKSK